MRQYELHHRPVDIVMLAFDPDLYHLLPPIAAHLAIIIGHSKTLLLLRRMGGSSFSVGLGKNMSYQENRQKLIDLIGLEDTEKIEAVFGAETIYIPRCQKLRQIMRDRSIRAEFDLLTKETSSIKAVAALATRFDMSDRHVWRVLKQVS